MNSQKDPNRLEVYSEIRKSKILVGTLVYDLKSKHQTTSDRLIKYLAILDPNLKIVVKAKVAYILEAGLRFRSSNKEL